MNVRRILGLGTTGKSLTDDERKILSTTPPYAVILFGRNIESAKQLRDLVREIKSTSSEPPIILIDEEGGRVDRLRNLLPGLPSPAQFQRVEDPVGLAREFGRVIGIALRYFDIEVNLAPVVDIGREPEAKGLERRCFGTNVNEVINRAGAFIDGMHSAGVAATLKHFPGIGYGVGDPHYGASVIHQPLEAILAEDIVPFAVLGKLARSIMVGHGSYPQIDEPNLPASLSPRMARDLLRRAAGFDGLAMSDDMEMHAVSDLGTYTEIAERALIAGNDVLLFCSQIEKMPELIETLEQRLTENDALRSRVAEAANRAYEFRKHCLDLHAQSPSPVDSFETVRDEAGKFLTMFEASKFDDPEEGGEERREVSRTPGTGKTGREEWT
ncbi:MAG: beta-N-acetylhexosaminidase [Thermoanaerobaculia bacterium]